MVYSYYNKLMIPFRFLRDRNHPPIRLLYYSPLHSQHLSSTPPHLSPLSLLSNHWQRSPIHCARQSRATGYHSFTFNPVSDTQTRWSAHLSPYCSAHCMRHHSLRRRQLLDFLFRARMPIPASVRHWLTLAPFSKQPRSFLVILSLFHVSSSRLSSLSAALPLPSTAVRRSSVPCVALCASSSHRLLASSVRRADVLLCAVSCCAAAG